MRILLKTSFKVPRTDPALEETINCLSWSVMTDEVTLKFIQLVPGNWDGVAFLPSSVLPAYTVDFNPATLQMSVNSAPKITLSTTQAAQIQGLFDACANWFMSWFLQFYALSEWSGTVVP